MSHRAVIRGWLMRKSQIVALGAIFLSCGAALAQGKTPPPAADNTETFGDWILHCGVAPSGTGERACEVTSSIKLHGETNPIARLAFGRPIQPKGAEKNTTMRLVVLVPVNVTIAPGVTIAPEVAKPPLTLPFMSCIPAACFAEIELNEEQMQAFRNRSQPGQLTFTDPATKPVPVEISFKGLDQALDALAKR
jgi:invasion protein IalB